MEPFLEMNHVDLKPLLLMLSNWMSKVSGLSVGFSTRIGGVSDDPMSSLNCALHVNDNPDHVLTNRRIVSDVLNIPLKDWVSADQVHGHQVHVVTTRDRGSGLNESATAIPKTDALITNEPNVWLTSFYADCVPLYFLDPDKKVMGLAHAGWRGTVAEIARHTIEAMQEAYHCDVTAIKMAIGPSIGMCCYEVDDHVMKHVNKHLLANTYVLGGIDKGMTIYKQLENGKTALDLKQINRLIALEAGILPANIECSTRCTSCQEELFFSFRRDQGQTGRMMSWICLKEE